MKKILVLSFLFILNGCEGFQNSRYYKDYNDNKPYTSLVYSYDEYKYDKRYLKDQSYEEFKNSDKFNTISNFYKEQNVEWNLEAERVSKEYCSYFLSYFLPINFWNIRFTDRQYIRKAIKDLNREGKEGNSMKNIYIQDTGFGDPIFSFFCVKISGELINEEINENE